MENASTVLPEIHQLKSQLFPVIHRDNIYFASSIFAREKFITNPEKYLRQSPPLPGVPIRLVIVGPPKSGKSESVLYNNFTCMLSSKMYKLLTFSCKKVRETIWMLTPLHW